MGHGDGGDDGAESSPGGAHLRLGGPKRAGADNARREAVENQSDLSAGIAEKAARHVPERSGQQQAEDQIRHGGQPMKFADISRRAQRQRSGCDQVPQRRMVYIVGGVSGGPDISLDSGAFVLQVGLHQLGRYPLVRAGFGQTGIPKRSPPLYPLNFSQVQSSGSHAFTYQPEALRQKHKQQAGGQHLRLSKSFAAEESGHEEPASVLPWRGTNR